MQFFLTLALIAFASSRAIAFPIWRLTKPNAQPLAIVVGILLFLFLYWAEFVIPVAENARRGARFSAMALDVVPSENRRGKMIRCKTILNRPIRTNHA